MIGLMSDCRMVTLTDRKVLNGQRLVSLIEFWLLADELIAHLAAYKLALY